MKKKTMLFLAVLLALVLATGCGPGEKKESGAEKRASDNAGAGQLTIKGSDTMVHLVSAWAESFMKSRPGSEISVTGGGSGTGIAALINGTTDICAASRSINEKERKLATDNGKNPVEIITARDGIAVIVNRDNPIAELSVKQIGGIFSGAVSNWQEVGGPDQPIIVFSRESSSGTFVFFQEHVLNKADYTQQARFLPGTSAVVQAVGADRGAIGYVGLGFAAEGGDRIKALAVKATATAPAVAPSEESVRSGEYAIARPLYFYIGSEAAGPAREFIDFCLGPAGQKIVRETGYVPVQ